MSVISCVEGATVRVNDLVIVEKILKNWSLRLCLDPPDLYYAIKSEFNHPSVPEQIYNKRKGEKDTKNCVKVHRDDAHLRYTVWQEEV